MNESVKTLTFVVVAAAMAGMAVGSHFMNRPTNSADFELVGKPFFEEFTSASQAQSLEVVAVDPESALLQRFSVENKDGLWRIPSHHDYPAEAAARLATTATSVMGIERESLAGRLAKDHEKLGVVDPYDEELEDPEAAGKRVTLKDADGEVVVDYIIGKEAGEVVLSETDRPFGQQGNEKYYFVRRPDENQTYKVKLDIDLSTKFSDWIDPDLLRLSPSDLTRIELNNYSIEEDRSNPLVQNRALFKKQGDILKIFRATQSEPWALDGLEAEKEELQTSRINDIVGVLDELKIAGVRPKLTFKGHVLLTPDLQLNEQPEFKESPQEFARAIGRLQDELDNHGFNLAGSAEKLELVSQFGEMTVGTSQGVSYTMHIGKAVEGDEEAIEIGADADNVEETKTGNAASEGESKSKGDEKSADGNSTADEEASKSDDEEEEVVDNRFLLVRVALDKSLIQPQPVKPTEPVQPTAPEGYTPPKKAEAEEKDGEAKTDESAAEAAPEGVEPPKQDGDAEKPQAEDRKPEFVAHDEALQKYEEDKVRYGLDITRYEDEKKAFDEKAKEGQKLVDELNERFGQWYYVMSGDNLKTLRTERKDLVSKIEPAPGTEPAAPARPDITFPDLPDKAGLPKAPETIEPTEKDAENSTQEKNSDGDKAKEASSDEGNAQSDDSSKEKTESSKNEDGTNAVGTSEDAKADEVGTSADGKADEGT